VSGISGTASPHRRTAAPMPRPAFPYLSGQFVAGALEETDESNLAAHKRVLKHSIMASASFAEYSGR